MDLDDSGRLLLNELKRILVVSALSFDRQVEPKERESRFLITFTRANHKALYTVTVTATLVHNTLNPKYFGAIFMVEGWKHKCSAKTVTVDFMVVVQRVKPFEGITEEMVFINGMSPVMSEDNANKCGDDFKKDLVKYWS